MENPPWEAVDETFQHTSDCSDCTIDGFCTSLWPINFVAPTFQKQVEITRTDNQS